MTRYFIDTEFVEDGSTIDLISIGIVCEDSREYYAQSVEFKPKKASQWVKDNVLVHLWHCPYRGSYDLAKMLRQHKQGQCLDQQRGYLHRCVWRTRSEMVHEIKAFFSHSDDIELWGYYSAYDHVVFCQLFGTMMDLPEGYPMYTRDIKQWCDQLGNPKLPEQGNDEHNALADAKWNKKAWEFLHTLQDRNDK